MDLLDTLTADLRAKLTAPEMAGLLAQTDRLHENVPHHKVLNYIELCANDPEAGTDSTKWGQMIVQMANDILSVDPANLDD